MAPIIETMFNDDNGSVIIDVCYICGVSQTLMNVQQQVAYVRMVTARTSWADMNASVTKGTNPRRSKLPVKAKRYLVFFLVVVCFFQSVRQ